MYLAVSDVALETLIEPELPFAAGQVRQVLRDRQLRAIVITPLWSASMSGAEPDSASSKM
jgi:hypothetical protein